MWERYSSGTKSCWVQRMWKMTRFWRKLPDVCNYFFLAKGQLTLIGKKYSTRKEDWKISDFLWKIQIQKSANNAKLAFFKLFLNWDSKTNEKYAIEFPDPLCVINGDKLTFQ